MCKEDSPPPGTYKVILDDNLNFIVAEGSYTGKIVGNFKVGFLEGFEPPVPSEDVIEDIDSEDRREN